MKDLTSKANVNIKNLSKLIKLKKERDSNQLFVCEGAKLCSDMAESKSRILEAYFTSDSLEKYPTEAQNILECSSKSWLITEDLSEWLSDTNTPQGIFCVGEKIDNSLTDDIIVENGRYVLLENIQDAGNVGTIIRTALALGVNAVFLDSSCAEIYSPKTLRSSMGAVLKQHIVLLEDIKTAIEFLQTKGTKVFAAELSSESLSVKARPFVGSSAVLLGNEGSGLSKSSIDLCDESIIIPMSGSAQSLNVGVAAGILMWEMLTQCSKE